MTRRGFTFTELVLTVAIIGTVMAISVPKAADVKRRAAAARVLSDVEAVKNGTYQFYSDSGYFPREAGAGVIPTNMRQYLPVTFSFTNKDWTIDYQHWTSTTPSKYVKTGIQIGVSITLTDPHVGAAAMEMYGNNPKFTVGSKYTFLIVGL